MLVYQRVDINMICLYTICHHVYAISTVVYIFYGLHNYIHMKRSDKLAVPCFNRYNVPAWPGVRSMPFHFRFRSITMFKCQDSILIWSKHVVSNYVYIYIHILVHYIMCIYIYIHGVYGVSTIISIYIYIHWHGSMCLGPQNTMVMSFLLLVWPNLCNQDDFLFVHTHILFVGLIYGWILYSCAKINSCLHGLSYLKHRSKLHSMWTLFVGQKSI